MTTAEAKKDLRLEMLGRLRSMKAVEREAASSSLRKALTRTKALEGRRMVAAFFPLATEPDLLPLLGTGAESSFCYPRVEDDHLAFYHVGDPGTLVKGKFGVREPAPGIHEAVEDAEIDLLLVPGLAFSPRDGMRLGRGGGFYDRFLHGSDGKATTIGVCFSFQLRNDIPAEAFDAPVDRVITDC